ncbi:NAD(P)H-binding protein [uncultured Propionibacterium sp.]|uniref:NAD(P)H-binding protein n=1 Tax=uncultured Propionibacterium sp. TaxID=218066 RepID=UPI00292F5CDF|nr:NAD(P)H-binding protein [uncultured Propionibacterium sp.]
MARIAITGATGRIGGMVARLLEDGPDELALIVSDASRAPEGPWQVHVTSGYADPANEQALVGADVLLMVSAAESEDRLGQHEALIASAAAAGVPHVVYTSFLGAGPDATFTLSRTHWATEQAIRASGMAFTLLRDSFYLDFLPQMAVDGVIAGPAGDGVVGAVAQADVAASAAAVLAGPARHAGATYNLTGPRAIGLAQVAETVTRLTGVPTTYRDETVEEAYASRARHGVPDWQLDAWVSTYTAIAAGEVALVTDDVRALTGREPLSLEQLLAR